MRLENLDNLAKQRKLFEFDWPQFYAPGNELNTVEKASQRKKRNSLMVCTK